MRPGRVTLFEHPEFGPVKVTDHRHVRCHALGGGVHRRQVVQVQDIGVGRARIGERALPRADLMLVLVVVERGEDTIGSIGPVLVGRVHRHGGAHGVGRPQGGRHIDDTHVEALVEGPRIAVTLDRAADDADVDPVRTEGACKVARDVRRAPTREELRRHQDPHRTRNLPPVTEPSPSGRVIRVMRSMVMAQPLRKADRPAHLRRPRVTLGDGRRTTVHVAAHPTARTELRVALVHGQPLAAWCGANGIGEAMVGGFFTRPDCRVLGELRCTASRARTCRSWRPRTHSGAPAWCGDGGTACGSCRARGGCAAAPRTATCSRPGPCSSPTARSPSIPRPTTRASAPAPEQFDSDITAGAPPARRVRAGRRRG